MNTEDKIANPAKYYANPQELNTEKMSLSEKIKLLENWLDDIIAKQVAEEENMTASIIDKRDFTTEIQQLLSEYKAQQL